jgi:hypothetical protein
MTEMDSVSETLYHIYARELVVSNIIAMMDDDVSASVMTVRKVYCDINKSE